MKNKLSISPKPSTKLNLKKVLVYVVVVSSLLSGVVYTGLTFFGVLGNPTEAFAANSLGYSWEAVITVDHTKVAGQNNLIDFPILIKIANPDLKSVNNGGKVESNDGFDIIFTDMADSLLDHEMESFNPVTGEYVGWVRIPTLSAVNNTDLKMYFGNSSVTTDLSNTNVWDGIYEGVWHMDENAALSNLKDAAGAYDAQGFGGMSATNLTPGIIGEATTFDGSNDYYAIKNKKYNSAGAISNLSISGWVKTTFNHSSWSKNWSMLDFDRSEYFNVFIHGDGRIGFSTRGAGIDDFYVGTAGQFNDGAWHHIAAVYDGTNKYVYADGVLMGTKNNPHHGAGLGTGATRYGFIGEGSEASTFNGGRNGIYYQGEYDEIRYAHQAFSAEWVATAYANQTAPEMFSNTVFNSSALPVELIDFSVNVINSKVEISWSTATEINNDFFTIEKSTDALNFDFVEEVTGAGNSKTLKEYTAVDDDLIEGTSYYRLKQTDFDGEFKYFSPKTINSKTTSGSLSIKNISPNPFTNLFTVSIESESEGLAKFTITNINGRNIDVGQIELNKGFTEYVYSKGGSLPSGTYIFKLLIGGNSASYKIIKT